MQQDAARCSEVLQVSSLVDGVPRAAQDEFMWTHWFRWLITLRWLAVAVELAVFIPLVHFGILREERWAPYLSAVTMVILVNVISSKILRYKSRIRPVDLVIQITLDLINFCMLASSFLPFAFITTDVVRAHIILVAHLAIAFLLWKLIAWIAQAIPSLQGRLEGVDRLRALGAVAAGLSHELATPLNTVRLRVERIARRAPVSLSDDVEAALDALDQCDAVLRAIASTRPDAACLDSKVVGVRLLLEQICTAWRQAGEADERTVEIHGGETARCRLPPLAISQTFLSLLDNAFEASPTGSPIEIHLAERDGTVEIAFLDRGPGIPELVRRHFGEPFVTTKPNGTGLGLYNALTLARALGGDVTLGSRDCGGATVAIALPLAGGLA